MRKCLKPKYKAQDIAYISVLWAKRLIMKVRIKSVKKVKINGQITYQYYIWRYRSANEAGCYWGAELINELSLFSSYEEAWTKLTEGLSPETIDEYCSRTLVDEDPNMTPRQIKKYNKEHCAFYY